MYILLIFLPLINSIFCGLFGKKIGYKGASIISTILMLICTILSYLVFYEVSISSSPCTVYLFRWFELDTIEIEWLFFFDSLTVVMLLVINTISCLVHIYSTGYMSNDPHLPRFLSYLSLFTFFMIMLVTSNNFVQLFLGWEGVGLASYLLISFWFTRVQASKSAIKAMIINRIGDFGLLLGILCTYFVFKSLDFSTVFALVPYFKDTYISILSYDINSITLICLLLFIGAMGKSAQLGLHTWLPDAMEGPTPVSALIHAATMVTAGVFLIVRCSPIFEYSSTALSVVAIVGASTALFAATIGLVQNDIKRVIAYSTCSQLGYMVFSCGLSNYSAGMFHLMNHAFFKALLFLGAGSVIHSLGDEQDMRKMGGLVKLIPFTYSMMLIGSLSLAGFPFLTGYYSKDLILELAYSTYTVDGTYCYWLGVASVFLTSFYSFRLLFLTFYQKTNAYKKSIENIHELPFSMGVPLIVLALGSIFVGYLTKDMIVGLGSAFWGNSIFVLPSHSNTIDAEFINPIIKVLPTCLSLLGILFSIVVYRYFNNLLVFLMKIKLIYNIYNFLNKRWFFDKLFSELMVYPLLSFSYNTCYKLIDRGILQYLGGYGSSKVGNSVFKLVSKFHTGYIYNYAFIMLFSIVFFLVLYTVPTIFLGYVQLDIVVFYFVIFLLFVNITTKTNAFVESK